MLGLQYFTFREIWGPSMLLFCLLLGWGYLTLTSRSFTGKRGLETVSFNKKMFFISGLLFYYLGQGGPMNLLAHLTFTVHMLDMSLTYLIVPPMLIYGLPGWTFRSLTGKNAAAGVFHAFSNPVFDLFFFNMLFSFYHVPQIFDFVMTHYTVHILYRLFLMISALLMWWHIVCPLPELERLTDLKKMGYVFANGALLTPACALIIFANHPLYGTFTDPNLWAQMLGECIPGNTHDLLAQFSGPRKFLFLPTTLEDQQAGGVAMKLIQEAMYAVFLFYIFIIWYRRENPKNTKAVDPLPDNLEERLEWSKQSTELKQV